jgi:16S rRNA (guanine966-N2)-methyltransferase
MRIISGEHKGRIIKTGTGPGYRPATGKVRESLFSILEARGICWSGTEILDIYAGSGALGLEALSRGAKSAWFIEKSSHACAIIRQNILALKISRQRARVIKSDALTFINKKMENRFDLVFVDPPYGLDLVQPSLDGLIKSNLVRTGGLISIEMEAHLYLEVQLPDDLELIKDRHFGQTRILIWKKN